MCNKLRPRTGLAERLDQTIAPGIEDKEGIHPLVGRYIAARSMHRIAIENYDRSGFWRRRNDAARVGEALQTVGVRNTIVLLLEGLSVVLVRRLAYAGHIVHVTPRHEHGRPRLGMVVRQHHRHR